MHDMRTPHELLTLDSKGLKTWELAFFGYVVVCRPSYPKVRKDVGKEKSQNQYYI